MQSLTRSSGDILADRRFAYAEALLAEGDADAAADLLAQVLERVPRWVPAWMALATARERLHDTLAAMTALEAACRWDGDRLYGADLRLAQLRGEAIDAMPAPYVAALFDDYAPRFEQHLVEGLRYRGPAAILDALAGVDAAGPAFRVLDLGCGTGLMGAAIRATAGRLDGIDLSPVMVEQARRTGLYDTLAVGRIEDGLAAAAPGSVDLVLAADVFVYVGALEGVFAQIARVLAPGGRLAFTLQRSTGAAMELGADLRFAHSADHVAAALAGAGLVALSIADTSTRRERGHDVPGLVVVARSA